MVREDGIIYAEGNSKYVSGNETDTLLRGTGEDRYLFKPES
jgi:hypothetical protein